MGLVKQGQKGAQEVFGFMGFGVQGKKSGVLPRSIRAPSSSESAALTSCAAACVVAVLSLFLSLSFSLSLSLSLSLTPSLFTYFSTLVQTCALNNNSMCVPACRRTYRHATTYIRTYIRTFTYTHTDIRTYIHINTNTRIHIWPVHSPRLKL